MLESDARQDLAIDCFIVELFEPETRLIIGMKHHCQRRESVGFDQRTQLVLVGSAFDQALLFDAQPAILEARHEQRVIYGFLFVFRPVIGSQLFLQNVFLVAQVGKLFDELLDSGLSLVQQIPL